LLAGAWPSSNVIDARLAHSKRKAKKRQEPHDTQAFLAVVAHQNVACTPVRGAPAVSGPPIEDKLLPMWRRPLAVGCATTLQEFLETTSVDALLFCWQQLAALRRAACSVPVCVWLALLHTYLQVSILFILFASLMRAQTYILGKGQDRTDKPLVELTIRGNLPRSSIYFFPVRFAMDDAGLQLVYGTNDKRHTGLALNF
jgi:hypothetical protein